MCARSGGCCPVSSDIEKLTSVDIHGSRGASAKQARSQPPGCKRTATIHDLLICFHFVVCSSLLTLPLAKSQRKRGPVVYYRRCSFCASPQFPETHPSTLSERRVRRQCFAPVVHQRYPSTVYQYFLPGTLQVFFS